MRAIGGTRMDGDTIVRIRPERARYLGEFDGCFGRTTTHERFACSIRGQLSDLRRKSIEPMADAAGIPPRNLQQLLSLFQWDEDAGSVAAPRESASSRLAFGRDHR